jgi:hypothetical protein
VTEAVASSPGVGRLLRRVRGRDRAGWRTLKRDRLLEAFAATLSAALPALAIVPVLGGRVNLYGDLGVFYWPVAREVSAALREGRLPLWTPNLFAGYPLFADGEAGTLYPTNLLLLGLFPAEAIFPYLTLPALILAALFAFFLARTLGVGRFPALLAGWTFALSGFAVGHLEHPNLLNSAVWLPFVIACLERAIRGGGRRRALWAVAGAGGVGLSGLGVHPHAPLLIAIVAFAYALFRSLGRPLRLAPVALVAAMVLGGLAAAAVQLLPMYELATYSTRSGRIPYEFNLEYSFPPFNLITFLFPYFFLSPGWADWGLWGRGEIAAYVGVLPLGLAALGVAVVRRGRVAFWVGVAVVSLLIMFANYSPLNVHRWLVEIPGFSVLRAPGRFALSLDLALALLAAFGADWLLGHRTATSTAGVRESWRSLPRRVRAVLLGGVLGAVLVPPLLLVVNRWVGDHPQATAEAIARWYLERTRAGVTLYPSEVKDYLLYATDPRNLRLTSQFALLLASASVLVGAAIGRRPRLSGRFALAAGGVWPAFVALVVAADLLGFAWRFYPDPEPASALAEGNPALRAAAGYLGAEGGRLYSSLGQVGTAPNRLVALGLPEANGYSSLQPQRHAEYVARMRRVDSPLLDRLGARLWALPTRQPPANTYKDVWFHPERPLIRLGPGAPAERATFRFEESRAARVKLVAMLVRSPDALQDEAVAELTLRAADGREERRMLRAGREVAEWAYRRPDVARALGHQPVEVAFDRPGRDGAGQSFLGALFYAERPLAATLPVREISLRYLRPSGALELYGLTLADTGAARRLTRADLARFRRVYRDADVTLLENRLVMPRASVLHHAVTAGPAGSLATTEEVGHRLDEIAVIETAGPPPRLTPGPPEPATILREEPTALVIDVNSTGDGLLLLADAAYPGWRASVDGAPVELLRADHQFRAVHVPDGRHVVRFAYEPEAVRLGAAISGAALVAAAGVVAWALWGLLSRRGRRA